MHYSYKILLTLLTCLFVTISFAQGPPGPPATPIDGGLGLLLVGATVYGVKKIRDHKMK